MHLAGRNLQRQALQDLTAIDGGAQVFDLQHQSNSTQVSDSSLPPTAQFSFATSSMITMIEDGLVPAIRAVSRVSASASSRFCSWLRPATISIRMIGIS